MEMLRSLRMRTFNYEIKGRYNCISSFSLSRGFPEALESAMFKGWLGDSVKHFLSNSEKTEQSIKLQVGSMTSGKRGLDPALSPPFWSKLQDSPFSPWCFDAGFFWSFAFMLFNFGIFFWQHYLSVLVQATEIWIDAIVCGLYPHLMSGLGRPGTVGQTNKVPCVTRE